MPNARSGACRSPDDGAGVSYFAGFLPPVVTEVAARLKRTPAQVLLRWGIEHGLTVLPKSTTPSRIAENGVLFAFAALAAAGCASQPKEPAPAPEAPEQPRAEQPAPPAAFPGAPGAGVIAGGAVLLPPAAGESRTALEGCLASTGTEEAGARFPALPVTRSAAPPPVMVGVSGLGVQVTHQLSHPCCLRAEVTSAVENGAVTVTEKLSGTPCRCMCSSTIRTAVGLAPGSYELEIRLQAASGETSVVHRQKVEIKRLRP